MAVVLCARFSRIEETDKSRGFNAGDLDMEGGKKYASSVHVNMESLYE
jgi:hypothetical protein